MMVRHSKPFLQRKACLKIDIVCIKEDSKGNIWLGTFNGIVRFNPADSTENGDNEKSRNRFKTFTIQDGFINSLVTYIHEDHEW